MILCPRGHGEMVHVKQQSGLLTQKYICRESSCNFSFERNTILGKIVKIIGLPVKGAWWLGTALIPGLILSLIGLK
jgi:hypothetical protein